MKLGYKIMLTACVIFNFVLSAEAFEVSVPGTSDPWLAGMPNGSSASWFDVAPAQSPVLVGISITPGTSYVFRASGLVDHGLTPQVFCGPDGDLADLIQTHWTGAENGIANVNAPYNCLLGVFLGPDQPNLSDAPATLDFSSLASRNYETLSPLLKQAFFIGDGLTDSARQQSVIAPPGATRLFLGTMDIYEWSNNTGSFAVEVTPVPEPATLLLLGFGAIMLSKGGKSPRFSLDCHCQKGIMIIAFAGRGKRIEEGEEYESTNYFDLCHCADNSGTNTGGFMV